MKSLYFIFLAMLASINLVAQQKNPTNAKEVQDKINQAQQQLDKLTPEQKKMMEQMGMSTKAPEMPAAVSDAGVNAAVSGGSAFGVPAKNAVLIGAIPQITLTAATLPPYIKTLNDYIEKGIATDAKFTGKKVYDYFKTNKYNAESIGNEAVGFWTIGKPEIAVYIMGKACADNATDADLLSNFAAMLSMGGAPHRAIPLLEYLNKEYPDNTTILNNLGQAWFYLGEINKADANLEKVVKAFAYHPQANYTQCLIQQSKGNTPKAIEKMKNSLAYSYSLDKINMLRKLGYSVKGTDMRKPFRPDPDPLGLHNFVRPDVPTTYAEELKLAADWDAFQEQAGEKSRTLAKDLIPYQQAAATKATEAYKKLDNKSVKEIRAMKANAALPDNIYRRNAEINLGEMNKDGGAGYRLKKAKAEIDVLIKDFQLKDEPERKSIEKQNSIKADKESELAKKGENIGYDNCVVQQKYSEWVYANYNKPLEEAYKNYLHQLFIKINEELYWEQFVQDDASFEATKITAKKEWLAAISNSRYITTKRYGDCTPQEEKSSNYKLGKFDDMHCKYISTLDLVVFKEISACGKAHVEFDAGRLTGGFDFEFDDKGVDHFVKGTLELTAIDKSVSVSKGPLQVGAAVKAGVGVEFTSRGVEDFYVTGEVSVFAKTNIIDQFDRHISEANGGDKSQLNMDDAQLSDKGIEVGVSGRMSLISGNMSGGISGFGK